MHDTVFKISEKTDYGLNSEIEVVFCDDNTLIINRDYYSNRFHTKIIDSIVQKNEKYEVREYNYENGEYSFSRIFSFDSLGYISDIAHCYDDVVLIDTIKYLITGEISQILKYQEDYLVSETEIYYFNDSVIKIGWASELPWVDSIVYYFDEYKFQESIQRNKIYYDEKENKINIIVVKGVRNREQYSVYYELDSEKVLKNFLFEYENFSNGEKDKKRMNREYKNDINFAMKLNKEQLRIISYFVNRFYLPYNFISNTNYFWIDMSK